MHNFNLKKLICKFSFLEKENCNYLISKIAKFFNENIVFSFNESKKEYIFFLLLIFSFYIFKLMPLSFSFIDNDYLFSNLLFIISFFILFGLLLLKLVKRLGKKLLSWIWMLFCFCWFVINSEIFIVYSYLTGSNIVFYFDLIWRIASCFFVVYLGLLFLNLPKKCVNNKSYFLLDRPIHSSEEDVFEFSEDAKSFANLVLNNGSVEPIVFGLDAPWGSGKTTYLNLCRREWENRKDIKVIEFNPLHYSSDADLLKEFAEELKCVLSPNAKESLKVYLSKISINCMGVGVDFGLDNDCSLKQAYDNLEQRLLQENKKIIVIIDDLDRADVKDIKIIIDFVRKVFFLPNISYMLCYDTDNMYSFGANLKNRDIFKFTEKDLPPYRGGKYEVRELDSTEIEFLQKDKIVEYFEKVVSIKKTIVLDKEKIQNYLIKELCDIFKDSLEQAQKDKIKKEISLIFSSKYFQEFYPYIGDMRKVKRIINIFKVIFSQYEEVNVKDRDINYYDYIILIMIYINYPAIFRKIYISEYFGEGSFFTLNYNYDDKGKRLFVNSEDYKKYVKHLGEKERFLLDQIFSEKRFSNTRLSDSVLFSSVAFKDGLIECLKLITGKKLKNIEDTIAFHENNVKKYKTNKGKLSEFLNGIKKYSFSKENNAQKNIWLFFKYLIGEKIYIKSDGRVNKELVRNILQYIEENIDKFSLVDSSDEFLDYLLYYYLFLLNVLDKHPKASVNAFRKLLSKQCNIKAIYYMISFKRAMEPTLHNKLGNVYKSFFNKKIKDDQGVMKEISLNCYDYFKKEYIDKKLNFLDDIDNLTEKQIFNENYDYVMNNFINDDIRGLLINEGKNNIRNRILCTMSNHLSDDNKKAFTRYLCDICFKKEKGIIHFLDYVLTYSEGKNGSIIETDKMQADQLKIGSHLDLKTVKKYLQSEREAIIQCVKLHSSREVVNPNRLLTYGNDAMNVLISIDSNFKE